MTVARGPDATGAGGDAFATAYAHVRADPQIQFALPRIPPPHIPEWLRLLGHALRAAWPVLRIGVWVAMAAAVLALLWLIVRRLIDIRWPWSRAPVDEQDPAEAEWRPGAAPARALLAEADALATAGRYGEAARLVLQRSIEDIVRRRPGLVRPATTSRDLAEAPQLPPLARPASAEAWTRARAAYADFALAGHWR